ncbi:hypothetical protein IRJ16_09435 [Mucilaginibacter myungsuensis]|uniref:Uncharacterized protein n=2 Tax=Mucilaginibacter myungsuensis TaxID=649104 RepID=A0A929PX74_9SPHI|nr:hypothetical protein [Mucilaginibacter myungsuensis]
MVTNASAQTSVQKKTSATPKIVNIVNFIRLLEPRDAAITQDVLYQTVVKQVDIMKKYKLGGTFLLQYDALMDSRYQKLLKTLPAGSFEIGGWWEIPQPLVEKAGLKWRGRYPWDWHADIGFSTGYDQKEREKLIDVYFADFKQIFGYYPKSVGSWFIDSYSLNYMYDKYGIIASSNCKDQYGTDGYTLWGGYWNQAYYPSRTNSYMPAQHAEKQLPVPIFRMLGSDPIRQYDTGLESSRQGVITLEPVYKFGGGDSTWVNWFIKSLVDDVALGFNYTQAGQENSFTWDAMAKGFEIQMPLIAKLRNEGKVKVETLVESGRWFKKTYKVTPPTSYTVAKDLPGSELKTAWFNSRYYRVNFLWEKEGLRIRDIHLFDEDLPSIYHTQAATSNECQFFTLPLMDGYIWSKRNQIAGLRLKAIINGKEVRLTGGQPIFTNTSAGSMHISWPLANVKGKFEIDLNEKDLKMKLVSAKNYDWYFDMTTAAGAKLPFQNIADKKISCSFENMSYSVKAIQGTFSAPGDGVVVRMKPQANTLSFDLSDIK